MTDFKWDTTTGDILVEGGLQLTTTNEEEAVQRLSMGISLNLGEWFLNKEYGVPWLIDNGEDFTNSIRYILGSNLPKPDLFLQKTLDAFIEKQDYIESVESEYDYNKSERTLTYTVKATLTTGEDITLTPFKVNL